MERMLERILLITTSTIAFSGQLAAQAYAELDLNDINAHFHSHGLIGADLGLGDPRFEVPAGQVCCGALHRHDGLADAADRLLAANIAAFRGDAPIVHNSAGCGAASVVIATSPSG